MALIDIGLPGDDGLTLAQNIATFAQHIGIIFVTGRTDLQDRLAGFEIGAEDYITKPYDLFELEARLRVVIRRYVSQGVTSFGNISIDFHNQCAYSHGKRIALTPLEFRVLALLASNPMRLWTRNELLTRAWVPTFNIVSERTVDVRIRHIRSALGDDAHEPIYLETVHGIGYRWIALPAT